ncbi:hypothetical protein [Embleya scabrispora]|uniref:hypothetical protein n=1 Tax=Embleya scabrispora TaxID=159449 RepID=UPI001374AE48|nr:hypothetical protein [Embleya scabrispora]
MSGTPWEDMERKFAFTPAEEERIETERRALRRRERAMSLHTDTPDGGSPPPHDNPTDA